MLPLENMFTFTIPARPNLKESKSKIISEFTFGVYSEYTLGFKILACTQSKPKVNLEWTQRVNKEQLVNIIYDL